MGFADPAAGAGFRARVASFQARCKATGGGNRLQARVTLANGSHTGEPVTITVDGNPTPVTINGNKAQLSINNPRPGNAAAGSRSLAGCFPPVVTTCD